MSLKPYGARIKGALYETGITQKELAGKLGIAPETLSRKIARPERFTGGEMEIIRKTFKWKCIGGEA